MKHVVLAVVAGAVAFLATRLLFPLVLQYNVLFLVFPILLVASLLLVRAMRRGRSGS